MGACENANAEMSITFRTFLPIFINLIISVNAYFGTVHIIPSLYDTFIKARLFGIDMCKTSTSKVPEALGVVVGCVFLITMFIFIPIPFIYSLRNGCFPHNEFVEMIAALLSICCMLLLGFADDVLDLKWRYKLLFPTIASLPLLMVYYVNFNSTVIIIPKPLRDFVGFSVDIGILYYVYMGMLAVFCTNAINVLAGINGLEVGQSVIIALSIAVFNCIELFGTQWKTHQFSLYFVLPYLGTSFGLLQFNWYPAKVFVGDTFCYFSGMTFAVVGILGHFSKTMLLFLIPQIFNFIYSFLQILHFVPCPRHRLPKYNSKTNQLEMSLTTFHYSKLNIVCRCILELYKRLGLIYWSQNGDEVTTNNFTLINLVLFFFGPQHECRLTTNLLVIQILCTLLGFTIRYPLASIFYDM